MKNDSRNDSRPDMPGITGGRHERELDDLLRTWHARNAERATEGRDRLLRALAEERGGAAHQRDRLIDPAPEPLRARFSPAAIATGVVHVFRVGVAHPALRAAAALAVVATAAFLLLPNTDREASARECMLPDGGRLEAFDERGSLIGPCPLAHTDVDAAISGHFSRVTVRQRFQNPYDRKIEAVYTFPLSHRGAIDRMSMTVGDRVIVGEIKEREEAQRIYAAARAEGYVASLLEQERPNIFTQSVANIEPRAEVLVEISYVETVQRADGEFRFDFPMTVAPRYIPGGVESRPTSLPAELEPRWGINLRGPARLLADDGAEHDEGRLQKLLTSARPIAEPGAPWWGADEERKPRVAFDAEYADGSRERCALYDRGVGRVGGRWFWIERDSSAGTGYARGTDQVPDASRITPKPVHPSQRAGHDISVRVSIDSGGPAIEWQCESHELSRRSGAGGAKAHDNEWFGEEGQLALALATKNEIPNRDFRLRWRLAGNAIEEAIFTHHDDQAKYGPFAGGFFTLMLEPPARPSDSDLRPREIIFVLDSSGSMKGFPIEKAKALILRAISSMRPGDVFNVVSFNNSTDILWREPRADTAENREEAWRWIEARQGGGGTEMRSAVELALGEFATGEREGGALDPEALANRPSSGQRVAVIVPVSDLIEREGTWSIRVRHDLELRLDLLAPLPSVLTPEGAAVRLEGAWRLIEGHRVLVVDTVSPQRLEPPRPRVRHVLFVSDGQVGNDDAIVDAVRAASSRVRLFTVGIGSEPNRSLLDAMAAAGRGASDYLSLEGDADGAVERFVKRIERPVLTDISIAFDGVEVFDTIPSIGSVPDLYDESPLVIHGRYRKPGGGTVTVRGNTGAGPWERAVQIDLPERAVDHDVIATLWARARVDERLKAGDRSGVIALGESFSIMSPYTSFVAVEKSRLTIEGKPMLVAVPIEMPQGQSWEGNFGEGVRALIAQAAKRSAVGAPAGGKLRYNYSSNYSSNDNTAGIDNRQAPLLGDIPLVETAFNNAPGLDLDSALQQGRDPSQGACCLPNGNCANLVEGDCLNQGGQWHVAIFCGTVVCNVFDASDFDNSILNGRSPASQYAPAEFYAEAADDFSLKAGGGIADGAARAQGDPGALLLPSAADRTAGTIDFPWHRGMNEQPPAGAPAPPRVQGQPIRLLDRFAGRACGAPAGAPADPGIVKDHFLPTANTAVPENEPDAGAIGSVDEEAGESLRVNGMLEGARRAPSRPLSAPGAPAPMEPAGAGGGGGGGGTDAADAELFKRQLAEMKRALEHVRPALRDKQTGDERLGLADPAAKREIADELAVSAGLSTRDQAENADADDAGRKVVLGERVASLDESLLDATNALPVIERAALREQAILAAIDLARADDFENAKLVAEWALAQWPDDALLRSLEVILADESLPDVRLERLEPIAVDAQARLDALAAMARRAARVARVVDESLRAAWPEETRLVTVLVTKTTRDVLDRLRTAGLAVEAQSKSIVVGRLARIKLVDLAMLEEVRRIEPTS